MPWLGTIGALECVLQLYQELPSVLTSSTALKLTLWKCFFLTVAHYKYVALMGKIAVRHNQGTVCLSNFIYYEPGVPLTNDTSVRFSQKNNLLYNCEASQMYVCMISRNFKESPSNMVVLAVLGIQPIDEKLINDSSCWPLISWSDIFCPQQHIITELCFLVAMTIGFT